MEPAHRRLGAKGKNQSAPLPITNRCRMSAAPKLEVAKDGVVRIPKSVFESDPAAAPAPAGGPVTTVRRLDGTIQKLEKIGVNNPNFVARKAWPGGNIVTSNKDAVR